MKPRTRKKRSKRTPRPHTLLTRYALAFIVALIVSGALWVGETFEEARVPSQGLPAELYANQTSDDLTASVTAAIDRAEKSVLLIVYSLTDPTIIDCLKRKSLQGVNVRVICDAKASPYADTRLGPAIATTRRFGPGLMHQKILVIDGQETWLGSANMTSESLRMHGNLITAMKSAAIADHIIAKAATMQVGGHGRPFPHRTFDIGGQEIELWFLPDDKRAVARLQELIRGAQKTVKVAMFTFTRYDLAQALIDAKKRGLKTEVVIDHNSGKGASAKVAAMLKAGGVDVSFSRGSSLLHHKFLYIDGTTLAHGSANWTKAAFTQNDDCFIVMPALTDAQHQHMEALWTVVSNEGAPL